MITPCYRSDIEQPGEQGEDIGIPEENHTLLAWPGRFQNDDPRTQHALWVLQRGRQGTVRPETCNITSQELLQVPIARAFSNHVTKPSLDPIIRMDRQVGAVQARDDAKGCLSSADTPHQAGGLHRGIREAPLKHRTAVVTYELTHDRGEFILHPARRD